MPYADWDPTITARLVRYDELTEALIEDWRKLLAENTDFDSALLTPEFAALVSTVRDDARILLIERAGRLQALLAMHKRPGGVARPLGAPFSDYSGPLVRKGVDIDLSRMLSLARVPAYESATTLSVRPREEDAKCFLGQEDSHIIRPAHQSGPELLEQQRALHPKRFKNFRRLHSQFEREVGPLKFRFGRPSVDELTTLLNFKSQQFLASGYVDLTQATEPVALLSAVAGSEHSFIAALTSDGAFVSGHFGFKCGKQFHPWISAFDPQWSAYSPGILLLLDILHHWDAMDLDTYDLAGGHEHYKKYFANASRPSRHTFIAADNLAGLNRKVRHELWKSLGAFRQGTITGRLKRRMDHIATSELGIIDRFREFSKAAMTRATAR